MMASLTSTKDTSSRQDQWSRQGTAPDKMNGTDKTVITWDEGNLAKISCVCCWKVAVGGGGGAHLWTGFPHPHQGGCSKRSAEPSAHAVHYQDSRLESSQERPDSSTLGWRWEARWVVP